MDRSGRIHQAFRRVMSVGALFLTGVLGCKDTEMSSGVGQISVEALHDSLAANPDLLLIDVRTPEEWQAVRVRGIKRYIGHTEITARSDELSADSTMPIYLICRSGHRSVVAGKALARLGYRHVFSVQGGTNAWVAAGYPVDSGRIEGLDQ